MKRGCTCPRMDNAYGRGYMGIAGVYVWREDCPLHGPKIDGQGQGEGK